MKKSMMAAIALLASAGMFAQKAVITGTVKGISSDGHVFLMNIEDPTNLIPIEVADDGSYRLELDYSEPCARYFIADDPKGGFKFYIEPGMKANIDLEIVKAEPVNDSRVTYTGDCKDCYEFLTEGEFYQYAQTPIVEKYYGKDLNPSFAQFRQEFEYAVDKLKGGLMKVNNPTFRKWMKDDYEKKLAAGLSWYTELTSQPDTTYLAYLEALDRNGNLGEAQTYARAMKKFYMPEGQDKTIALLSQLNTLFSNKDMVNAIADEQLSRLLPQAPDNINELMSAYKAVSPERAVPENLQQLYDHYKTMVPGAKAVNFDMYDQRGKKILLSDLKGKAVYIDCWATWCGPCKAQTPYMVKLYEHFKNDKRIQLVSISLDKKEAAWKDMVKKENLAWPQYIVKGEFECSLCKEYNVTSIPRFMMFDKNGCIVSLDAPRPSEENIIQWIESKLQ